MIELQKLKFSKKATLISFLIVSLILNFIFKVNPPSFDTQIKSSFGLISPELALDSSIVLLVLKETDLPALGGWPIKRSLYAELIQKLIKQNVDKITLEIIFSDNGESNPLFDSLIQNSDNIILASLLTNKDKNGNPLGKDSLVYSYPKTLFPHLHSGHLNFLDDGEILIPSKIIQRNIEENSFALSIWGKDKDYTQSFIKPNLFRRYRSEQIISLKDFLENNLHAINLNGKTILIGRENELLSSDKFYFNNKRITGLILHAITYDNLINNRTIYYKGSDLVNLFFYISILLFILFGGNKNRILIWLGLAFLVYLIGFVLFLIFQWEFGYSILFYIIAVLGSIDYVYNRFLTYS
jgi:CHASE2 domain-containing sensor protein